MLTAILETLLAWLSNPRPLLAPRAPGWARLRAQHLAIHPRCAVCGTTRAVVPHHILPVHLWPDLEMEPSNLISLCEGPGAHHLTFGHLGNWTSYNRDVAEDAALWANKFACRPGVLSK